MLIQHRDNTAALELETTWFDKVKAEGRLEALREMVLRLLGSRFGSVPEPARQRIESLSSEPELQRLGERIVGARSLDELGLV